MTDLGNSGLNSLRAELEHTAVISDKFRSVIMGWAMEACRIAFERGQSRRTEGLDSLAGSLKFERDRADHMESVLQKLGEKIETRIEEAAEEARTTNGETYAYAHGRELAFQEMLVLLDTIPTSIRRIVL